MYNVTHFLLVIGKKYDETGLGMQVRKCANLLLVIGKDVLRLPFTKVQCHSQTVGHRRGYDKTAFHKMCNGAHSLLIIGKDMMRLPSQHLHFHSQTVGHRKDVMRLPFTKHVSTHLLLVKGKDVMKLPFTECAVSLTSCQSLERFDDTAFNAKKEQCHSQTIGYRKRCHEAIFHKMSNVTHKLLVIGRAMMRLPFTKCDMSTHSLLVIGKDVMRLPFPKLE